MNPNSGILALAAAALLAVDSTSFAAEPAAPVESARTAVYSSNAGDPTPARPAQYVATPWGSTWYGANSYAYAPTSYYAAPYYDYYGYGVAPYGSYGYTTAYRPALSTSYYAPAPIVPTYTYRPYYASLGPAGYSYGWLPYSYQTRPYGSFYRYYGPAYGSGFHLWFGY